MIYIQVIRRNVYREVLLVLSKIDMEPNQIGDIFEYWWENPKKTNFQTKLNRIEIGLKLFKCNLTKIEFDCFTNKKTHSLNYFFI